jgi:hypothetical protein
MQRKNLLLGGAMVLAATALSSMNDAKATVIYDNLAVSSGSPPASVLPAGGGPLGDSFSTPTGAVDLTDVKLLVDATTPSDGGSFTVSLFSNTAANAPGSSLNKIGTIADSSLTTSASVVDLPLTTPILLSAGTRYWIVLSGTTGSGNWFYTTVNSGTGVANEYNYFQGASSANTVFTPYQMQINVTAVPEPASFVLLLAGVVGIAAAIRLVRVEPTGHTA